MFTGIIEDLGEVKKLSRKGRVTLIEVGIKAAGFTDDVKPGDSIAVNGACLTAVDKKSGLLSFEAMPETLSLTNLGALKIRDKVNLERALKLGDRVSGHFVSGHVDCMGVIRSKRYSGGNLAFEISVPVKFMKDVQPKGSVAIDGISLTVVDKKANSFTVYLIPHTLEHTTLKFKGPSAKVNVEFDLLNK
ncbi:MAG: riboflavin synthase [Candidatus Omnitrophota bacterium]